MRGTCLRRNMLGECVYNKKKDQPILMTMLRSTTMAMMMIEPLPRGRGRKPISDVSSPPIRSKILLLIIVVVLTSSLLLVLRILPQQNTALLSHVRPSMYRVVFLLVRPIFSTKKKNVVQPTRIFCASRISWNRIS